MLEQSDQELLVAEHLRQNEAADRMQKEIFELREAAGMPHPTVEYRIKRKATSRRTMIFQSAAGLGGIATLGYLGYELSSELTAPTDTKPKIISQSPKQNRITKFVDDVITFWTRPSAMSRR